MNSSPWRIAFLNAHPTQYFAPLYAYLNSLDDFEVTALYCSDWSLRGARDPGFGQSFSWDIDLLGGYQAIFLGERARRRTYSGFWSLVCPEVWQTIRGGTFDALIIHGHNYAATLLALAAAKSKGIRVFARGETHLQLGRSTIKSFVRKPIMNLFYSLCDGCLAIGSANRDFYEAIGVPAYKIFQVPYTVDNDRFITESKITNTQRKQIRADFGLPTDQPLLLYASKFQRRKHPDDVLKAAAALQNQGLKLSVLMVGSGDMSEELKALSESLGLVDVAFPGFVNQTNLPQVYSASDIFVLPSENEPWALIVNEVMCAGLPVVVSNEVGCAPDLVREGVNGYTFAAGDHMALAESIRVILSSARNGRTMGQESLKIIQGWSYRECAAGLCRALVA